MKRISVIYLVTILLLIPLLGLNCESEDSGNESNNVDTTPPIISGITVSEITENAVTISWTTDEQATSTIEYGLGTSYGSTVPDSADADADNTSHSLTINDLSPDTTYHFRVKSADALANEASSADDTFTTGPDSTPPMILDIIISGISDTAVTISWTTDEQATSSIEYGLDTGYGSTVPDSADADADNTSHILTINDLSPDTIYHFVVKSKDALGNEAASADGTFTTGPDSTPPVISGVTIDDISDTAVTISWTTGEPATSAIEYGLNTGYGYSFPSPEDDTANNTSHTLTIGSLSPSTTYHFRVKSADALANEASSADYTFTTEQDFTSPVISGIYVSGITASSATINWTTNEPATNNIDYGLNTGYGYSFPSPADSTANNTSHSLTINSLSPSTTYHFRVKSADALGNEASSADYTFTTHLDFTPPVISGIYVTGITSSGATIHWTTNEPATSALDWGYAT